MGFFNEIGGLLEQYKGATASAPPPNVQQDFDQVSRQVPQNAMSDGLAEAFRSNETPSFGQMVSQLFGHSNGEQRAGILNHLLSALGPAGVSGAGGGLASLLGGRALQGGAPVTPEQAENVPPETVQNLAEHAKTQDPSIVDTVSRFYSQHPTLVQGLGAGALAIVMSHISKHV